jgi:hypothetical protein
MKGNKDTNNESNIHLLLHAFPSVLVSNQVTWPPWRFHGFPQTLRTVDYVTRQHSGPLHGLLNTAATGLSGNHECCPGWRSWNGMTIDRPMNDNHSSTWPVDSGGTMCRGQTRALTPAFTFWILQAQVLSSFRRGSLISRLSSLALFNNRLKSHRTACPSADISCSIAFFLNATSTSWHDSTMSHLFPVRKPAPQFTLITFMDSLRAD